MSNDTDELTALRRAVLNDPRNGELRYLLAAELAHQHDYEGAVLEFSAAIALSPHLHVARFQLGLLHLTLAQPQHTIAVLGPLEQLPDGSALKHFKRGLEALIVDDFTNCLAELRRGIELNTDNEPLNRDMSMLIERVQAAADGKQPADASAATNDTGATEVRTDFSLYGVTKH